MLRRLAGARPVDPAIAALRAEYWKVAGYQKPGGAIAMSHDEARAAGVGDSEIGALYLGHRGRHVDKWAHYLGAYEEQLGPFRRGFPNRDGSLRPLRILEIGVYKGGSLQLWRRYFGAQASVWGIDADPACSAIDDPDLEIRIGSQQDRRFLEGVVDEMGGVDVVIDDGSHQADHQRASFEVLFPLLSEGGIYAVEDLHTSYWRRYGGGYRRPGTFIEFAKGIIDDMHLWYHDEPLESFFEAASAASRVTLYDSMVFVRKAPLRPPRRGVLDRERFTRE